jgi:hypothetical protein
MQSRASHKPHGTQAVNVRDALSPNWRSRLGDVLDDDVLDDVLDEHDIARAFYVLLGDATLQEVFDDFATPAN